MERGIAAPHFLRIGSSARNIVAGNIFFFFGLWGKKVNRKSRPHLLFGPYSDPYVLPPAYRNIEFGTPTVVGTMA